MFPWKGAEIAFNVCKEIEKERKDVRFVFIGDGPLLEKLRSQAGSRFTFLKNISTEELAKWFNRANMLMCPTRYESFGRAIAEAMLCSTPIVSTKVGALPETVGPGGFLVEYGDWKGMKKYADMLLDDKKLAKKTGAAALKYAGQYKYAVVADKIYNIYQEALS